MYMYVTPNVHIRTFLCTKVSRLEVDPLKNMYMLY